MNWSPLASSTATTCSTASAGISSTSSDATRRPPTAFERAATLAQNAPERELTVRRAAESRARAASPTGSAST